MESEYINLSVEDDGKGDFLYDTQYDPVKPRTDWVGEVCSTKVFEIMDWAENSGLNFNFSEVERHGLKVLGTYGQLLCKELTTEERESLHNALTKMAYANQEQEVVKLQRERETALLEHDGRVEAVSSDDWKLKSRDDWVELGGVSKCESMKAYIIARKLLADGADFDFQDFVEHGLDLLDGEEQALCAEMSEVEKQNLLVVLRGIAEANQNRLAANLEKRNRVDELLQLVSHLSLADTKKMAAEFFEDLRLKESPINYIVHA